MNLCAVHVLPHEHVGHDDFIGPFHPNDSMTQYPPPVIECPGYVALLSFCFLAPSAGTSSTCRWNEQCQGYIYLLLSGKKKDKKKETH